MKEILNKLHLSIREFAELYEIPYQTVRQWTKGERRIPEYLKKLIEKDIERKTKGEQIELFKKNSYYVIEINLSKGKFLKIYEKDSISYGADKNFWENEEKKGAKYPPKIRCFEVIEK